MRKYIQLFIATYCFYMGYRSSANDENWKLFFIVFYSTGLIYFLYKNFLLDKKQKDNN